MLRIVRVLKVFHHLRVLAIAIYSSVGALVWSMVLLTIVQLLSAILIGQVVVDYLMDASGDLEDRREVFRYFGSATSGWLTMFEITLAPGAWGEIGKAED